MPCITQLPQWVSYLQALSVPIIAVFGVWIAGRQMVIASNKQQLDAFDRQYEKRVAVYEATRNILEQVFREKITQPDIRTYGLRVLDAQFLFDDGLFKYLRQILHRVDIWAHAKEALANSTSADERQEFQRISKENLDWIIQQGDEQVGFATKFTPFLVHSPFNRARWWHRPKAVERG